MTACRPPVFIKNKVWGMLIEPATYLHTMPILWTEICCWILFPGLQKFILPFFEVLLWIVHLFQSVRCSHHCGASFTSLNSWKATLSVFKIFKWSQITHKTPTEKKKNKDTNRNTIRTIILHSITSNGKTVLHDVPDMVAWYCNGLPVCIGACHYDTICMFKNENVTSLLYYKP